MASAIPAPGGFSSSLCWHRHRRRITVGSDYTRACELRHAERMKNPSAAFTPPSPGAWELEQTHLTRPPSIFSASIFPGAMMAGFKDGTRHYGILLDHLEVAVINRFIYFAPRAVGAPKKIGRASCR